jgi:DNA adenine methylase
MNAPVLIKKPTRPALRYHGGKWRLAPWIISFFPPHRVYVESFGGAASILIRKAASAAEVYNDLDQAVVTFFRVLQDPPAANRLLELLRLTPFARDEYRLACTPTDDPIERSRRLIIRSFMGFGSNAHNERGRHFRACVRAPTVGFRGTSSRSGFRANSNGSNTTPAHDWANYADALEIIRARFAKVVVENADAFKVMAQHDRPDTLHYLDPPYPPETRKVLKKKGGPGYLAYEYELTREDHIRLLDAADDLQGMVVLSSYPSSLYEQRLKSWKRFQTDALADGAKPRTEVLWLNSRAYEALEEHTCPPLLRVVAS